MNKIYKLMAAGCLSMLFAGNMAAYADEPRLQQVDATEQEIVGVMPASGTHMQQIEPQTAAAAVQAEVRTETPQQTAQIPEEVKTEAPRQAAETQTGNEGEALVQIIPESRENAENTQADTAAKRLIADAESQYANIAVSQVSEYVNIRQQPNTGSGIVGKIYNNCAATILETVNGEGGEWYRIQSGSVNGYIKAEYFITGDAAEQLAVQIGREFVTVSTEGLRLREQPSLDSAVLTKLSNGSRYLVQDSAGDFYKIEVDADLTGYIAKQYCKTTVEFDQAVSLEEEYQRQQEQIQRKQDADNALAALEAAIAEVGVSPSDGVAAGIPEETQSAGSAGDGFIAPSPIKDGGTEKTDAPSAGNSGTEDSPIFITAGPGGASARAGVSSSVISASRAAIVAYAKQFLGNPYVYGGTSLTEGTDCSGFVMRVFEHFGITTGRTSRDQAAQGKNISVTAAQPGDLLFYSSGDYINHVAIYIGNGQIIHAATAKTGICTANYDYRTPCKAVTFLD